MAMLGFFEIWAVGLGVGSFCDLFCVLSCRLLFCLWRRCATVAKFKEDNLRTVESFSFLMKFNYNSVLFKNCKFKTTF